MSIYVFYWQKVSITLRYLRPTITNLVSRNTLVKSLMEESRNDCTSFPLFRPCKFCGKETVCVDSICFSCSYLRDQKLMKKSRKVTRKSLNQSKCYSEVKWLTNWLNSFDSWLLLCLWIHHPAILLMGQGGPKHKPGQKIYDDLQHGKLKEINERNFEKRSHNGAA